ncbi:MAG TPA: methyltransferase domain-containing protein [Burkholderiales bacterium]|nr:methyltransferase domain-containing protein [Burkholderiales bacterium]
MTPNLERARDLFSRGLAEHLARNLDQAEALYREALALAPGRPSLVFNLGRLMLDRERDAEAEALFAQVLQDAPEDHEARHNLGVCLARQGRFEEAIASYDRAIALKPDLAAAHSGRGAALGKLERHDSSLASHARSVELEPARAAFQVSFCRAASAPALDVGKLETPTIERAVLACLAGRNVDYQALGRIAWAILHGRLGRLGFDPAALRYDFPRMQQLHPGALHALCNDALLLGSLAKITVGDAVAERLFTLARGALLRLVSADDPAPELLATVEPLVLALAQQGFLNEYVWDVTEAEHALVRTVRSRVERAIEAGTPSSAGVGILACYEPLAGMPGIGEWCRTKLDRSLPGLEELVRTHLDEPAIEAEIAAGLKQVGEIRDRTSLAVRTQYEQNPYPRWLSVFRDEPVPYTARILREIAPFSPPLKPLADSPQILIAGCGTGRHAIMYATGYLGARVTAIDLSSASLAYARRQADELGVRNVEFLRADILDLGALGLKFDVVSSVGVLHHMADPAEGLRRLTDLLVPGGYLMLGLYSDAARADIVELRSIIAREGFTPTLEGVRACRRFIRRYPGDRFRSLADEAADFYSTSMVRDLLFHVMEHRFTIPQIADLLAQNRLRFLGFTFQDPAAKQRYGARYPDDPDMLDLANWAALEAAHPWLFRGMYQFWTAKGPQSGRD